MATAASQFELWGINYGAFVCSALWIICLWV